MSSILLKQFIEGRKKYFPIEYTRVMGMKRQSVLDKIIPNISTNLHSSCLSFLGSLRDLDEQFIQSTATKPLQNILIPEIMKLKNSGTKIRSVNMNVLEKNDMLKQKMTDSQRQSMSGLSRFMISPYVIFGTSMQERSQLDKPWQNIIPVGSNRFIYRDPKGLSIKKIANDQVFGFNCFLTMINQGIEITEGNRTQEYEPTESMIQFETNADDQQFFVTDYNLLIRRPQ